MKYISYRIVIISILYINITQASLEPIEILFPIKALLHNIGGYIKEFPRDLGGPISNGLRIADVIINSVRTKKVPFTKNDLVLMPIYLGYVYLIIQIHNRSAPKMRKKAPFTKNDLVLMSIYLGYVYLIIQIQNRSAPKIASD